MQNPVRGFLNAAAAVAALGGTIYLVARTWGNAAALVGSLAGWLFARLVGPRVHSPPSAEFRDDGFVTGERRLPPLGWSYAPVLLPLVLITGGSVVDFLVDRGMLAEGGVVQEWAAFLGWPVLALGIGVVLAYVMSVRMTGDEDRENRRDKWVESALRNSAMIIMVTGLGGALSALLQATPAVDVIAENTVEWGIPAILLPFVLGVLANMITGSTTVGVITGATLSAPMLGTLGLSPEAAMLSAACGSVIIKYVNSSYFWVCTSLSRMPLRSALISYGGVTLVGGLFSMVTVVGLWLLGAI
jgi:gluconate:H+ symporter, GntP family